MLSFGGQQFLGAQSIMEKIGVQLLYLIVMGRVLVLVLLMIFVPLMSSLLLITA